MRAAKFGKSRNIRDGTTRVSKNISKPSRTNLSSTLTSIFIKDTRRHINEVQEGYHK